MQNQSPCFVYRLPMPSVSGEGRSAGGPGLAGAAVQPNYCHQVNYRLHGPFLMSAPPAPQRPPPMHNPCFSPAIGFVPPTTTGPSMIMLPARSVPSLMNQQSNASQSAQQCNATNDLLTMNGIVKTTSTALPFNPATQQTSSTAATSDPLQQNNTNCGPTNDVPVAGTTNTDADGRPLDTATYKYSVPNGGKEKTPMARIAELARFNRLCHEYKLIDETGPAHDKTFTVQLVLREGDEYLGHGHSIKKAQQDAAAVALRDNTSLARPPSFNRSSSSTSGSNSNNNSRMAPTINGRNRNVNRQNPQRATVVGMNNNNIDQPSHIRPKPQQAKTANRIESRKDLDRVSRGTSCPSLMTSMSMSALKHLAAKFGYNVKLNVKTPATSTRNSSKYSSCSTPPTTASATPDTDSVSSATINQHESSVVSNSDSTDSGIKHDASPPKSSSNSDNLLVELPLTDACPFTCLIELQHKQTASILRFSASATSKQVAKHEAIKVAMQNMQSWSTSDAATGSTVSAISLSTMTNTLSSGATSGSDMMFGSSAAVSSVSGHESGTAAINDNGMMNDADSHNASQTSSHVPGGEKKKSPVSIIHEVAFHRKLDVQFDVLSATGPAHNRTYVLQCTMSQPDPHIHLTSTGSGISKKLAKSAACEDMIEKLRAVNLYPVPTQLVIVATPNTIISKDSRFKRENKRNTLSKDMKMDPNYGQQINPISRLIQIQHARNEPEPKFKFVREVGVARQKEFVVEVTLHSRTCIGHGPNKKLAKRAAAELMLQEMGYAKPLPAPGKSVLKHKSSLNNMEMPEMSGMGSLISNEHDFVVDHFVMPTNFDETDSGNGNGSAEPSGPQTSDLVVCADDNGGGAQTFAQVDAMISNSPSSYEPTATTSSSSPPPPRSSSSCSQTDDTDGNGGQLERQNSSEKRRVTFQLDEKGRRRFEMNEYMDEQKLNSRSGKAGSDAVGNAALATAVYTAPTSTRKKCKDSRRLLSREQQSLIGTLARHFLAAGVMAKPPNDSIVNNNIPPSSGKSGGVKFGVGSSKRNSKSRDDNNNTGGVAGSGAQQALLDRRSQIEYIARTVGFGVQFTDFPQNDSQPSGGGVSGGAVPERDRSKDHLCLVTIGVGQPQVCHGTGATVDLAQMAAASNALAILAQQYGAAINNGTSTEHATVSSGAMHIPSTGHYATVAASQPPGPPPQAPRHLSMVPNHHAMHQQHQHHAHYPMPPHTRLHPPPHSLPMTVANQTSYSSVHTVIHGAPIMQHRNTYS